MLDRIIFQVIENGFLVKWHEKDAEGNLSKIKTQFCNNKATLEKLVSVLVTQGLPISTN